MIIIFILFYFVGKQFYILAEKFKRSNWGFALLGIASYYAGTFIAGVVFELLFPISESDFLETSSRIMRNILTIPFGLLAAYILHESLESNWRRKPKKQKRGETLDEEIIKGL